MSFTLPIREQFIRNRLRLQAIALRGMAQIVGTAAPLVVLSKQGASSFGLFSIFVSVAGLSVVLEWGLPLKVQNEISRGQNRGVYDFRWFLRDSGFPLHFLLNLISAILLWQAASAWLPYIFTIVVAKILGDHQLALFAIFAVAAGIGATYQGQSVLFGLGHIDKGFTFTLLGATVSFICVITGIAAGVPTTLLAVLVAAAPLFERILSCFYCFGRAATITRHVSMPLPLEARGDDFKSRRHVAPMFLYLQVLSLVANNVDAIYAARANSLRAVGEYAFLLKLFGIPLLVAKILTTAAQPRLAVEAHSGNSRGRGTVAMLLRSNITIVAASGGVIVLIAGWLYHQLTGLQADMLILGILMLIDACTLALRIVLTTFVNASEIFWLNIVGNTLFAGAAILSKVTLVALWGVNGLVIANIVCYVIVLLPFHVAVIFLAKGKKQEIKSDAI